MLNPATVLSALTTANPMTLATLPETHGLYGLIDHTGQIRYLGITESQRMGFRRRIGSYHVTGSEGRSHKFSHAYNTGRMWRARKGVPGQEAGDAQLAKALRSLFCRTYCRAVTFPVTPDQVAGDYFAGLTALERAVKALAPPPMLDWDRLDFQPMPEPIALVDALLDSHHYPTTAREALTRQAALAAALA